jgi:hypothetical protein
MTATSGRVLERMILPALEAGEYSYEQQVRIGQRLGCGTHKVDLVIEKAGIRSLVSLKWQQVSGTTEQKVPFEAICLADAIQNSDFQRAYLVLGGEGWTLRDFYVRGGLLKYLRNLDAVEILTLEAFIARANKGKL